MNSCEWEGLIPLQGLLPPAFFLSLTGTPVLPLPASTQGWAVFVLQPLQGRAAYASTAPDRCPTLPSLPPLQGRVVYASQSLAGILGYTPAALSGMALPSLLQQPFKQLHMRSIKVRQAVHMYSIKVRQAVHMRSIKVRQAVHMHSIKVRQAVHMYSMKVRQAVRMHSIKVRQAVRMHSIKVRQAV